MNLVNEPNHSTSLLNQLNEKNLMHTSSITQECYHHAHETLRRDTNQTAQGSSSRNLGRWPDQLKTY